MQRKHEPFLWIHLYHAKLVIVYDSGLKSYKVLLAV